MAKSKRARGRAKAARRETGRVTSSSWHITWLPDSCVLRMRHFTEPPALLQISGVPRDLAFMIERRSAAGLPTTIPYEGIQRGEGEDGWLADFAVDLGIETSP